MFFFCFYQTGDEMSKRTKFVLVTWVGRQVGVMDRAKVTNDKALVKGIVTVNKKFKKIQKKKIIYFSRISQLNSNSKIKLIWTKNYSVQNYSRSEARIMEPEQHRKSRPI